MEDKVFTNYLRKEFCMYVHRKSGKPLKALSKNMSKEALRQVSFWDEVIFLYQV